MSAYTVQNRAGIPRLDDYPDVLLPNECMEVLRLGRTSVYKLLRSGSLKSLKMGKKYIVPKSYLLDYLQSGYGAKNAGSPAFPGGKEGL